MQSPQHKSYSAPSLHSSTVERAHHSISQFAENTESMGLQQSFSMAGFEGMQGSGPWDGFSDEPAGFDVPEQSIGGEYFVNYNDSTSSFPTLEHSSSTESQTISPSQMHISQPASGALTYQSTPQTDFLDSPACFSNDPSPNWTCTESPAIHDTSDFDPNMPTMQMFPELPGNDTKDIVAPEPVPPKSVVMSRKGSSPGKASPNARPVGITKKKKSRGPLPDIKVDPNDPIAVKRARNTAAARTSREKKAMRVEFLEQELELWKNRAIAAGWQDEDEGEYEPI